jgi:hypothetical protein
LTVGLAQQESVSCSCQPWSSWGSACCAPLSNYSQRYASEWIAAHIGYDLRIGCTIIFNGCPFPYHDHA